MSRPGGHVETTLRALAPQVLGVLVRRHGRFDLCEDAVQEALVAASTQWSVVPEHPRGWLLTVAERRLIDALRAEGARHRREAAALPPADAPAAAPTDGADEDDTLELLVLCCHPALTAPSQLALTLRAVGGLTTAEIARALLVPEATMGQRIARAKQRIREAGGRFALPDDAAALDARLTVVRQVLYLVFNEGYVASSGPDLHRTELTAEALRLTRLLAIRLPDDGEVAGLLALMLLTDARRAARTTADGFLVPLAEQDRSRWDREQIAEGVALVTEALATRRVGPYQLQAAIAAVHAEAPTADATDWPQVLALYELLQAMTDTPVVTLNRAVAVGMVDGPRAGLALLDELEAGGGLPAGHHRVPAVRGHLLERAGDTRRGAPASGEAARLATSVPEQRFLAARAAALRAGSPP